MKMLDTPAWLMLLGALLSTAGAILASQRQAVSEEELRKKSEEIAELNKQIAASLTGADSFAYVVLAPFHANDPSQANFTVIHVGKYPLYDVGIRIADLDQIENKERTGHLITLNSYANLNVGNLSPNQARVLDAQVRISNNSLRLNIFLFARNGSFSELLRVQRIDGKLKIALKVTRDAMGSEKPEVLLEKIDHGYPVGADGKVKWE